MHKSKQCREAKQQEHWSIMVSFKAMFLAAAICAIFQAAIASQLSIYKGANCLESTIKTNTNCTDGRGVGTDSACINFVGDDVSYKFRYQGTPFRLYAAAGCAGQAAISSNDIGCTRVGSSKSYKVLCRSRGN